eukprot:8699420-Pyramimonas_sp.AAC.1
MSRLAATLLRSRRTSEGGCLPRQRGERIGDLVRSPQYADGPFSTQRTKLEPNSSGRKLASQEW